MDPDPRGLQVLIFAKHAQHRNPYFTTVRHAYPFSESVHAGIIELFPSGTQSINDR